MLQQRPEWRRGSLTTGETVYAYDGAAYLFGNGGRVVVRDWFDFCGMVRHRLLSWS